MSVYVSGTGELNERLALQFQAEFFNLFNHANFSLPNVDFNSAAFGSLIKTPDITAGNPRRAKAVRGLASSA